MNYIFHQQRKLKKYRRRPIAAVPEIQNTQSEPDLSPVAALHDIENKPEPIIGKTIFYYFKTIRWISGKIEN